MFMVAMFIICVLAMFENFVANFQGITRLIGTHLLGAGYALNTFISVGFLAE